MNNKIPSLAYIKRQAKNLKKEKNISHTQALELIAKDYGFSNWKHCQRSLTQQPIVKTPSAEQPVHLGFTDWLKKHKNRDSPLGDLAKDMLNDKTWPLYNDLEAYRSYLRSHNASSAAVNTLERAWKSHAAFLRRKSSPHSSDQVIKKPVIKNYDSRTIIHIKGINPLRYDKRTIEKFCVGDKAWISWNGRKAIPVTILEVDERHYTFRTERPLKNAGSTHFVFLDEVRSTPELACINHVTL